MPMTFSIRLVGSPNPFLCAGDWSVLAALAPVHQQRIASGCHGGVCGVCQVRVCDGAYRTGRMSRAHISEAERGAGIALACRIYPESDLTIEAWGKLPARIARRHGFLPTGDTGRALTPGGEEKSSWAL
jgi:ferredoxin